MLDDDEMSYGERLARYIREKASIKATDPAEYEKQVKALAEKWRI